MERFLARQPIFDHRQRIFAYELLFRSGLDNFFDHPDGDQATSQVIANSFLLFGIDTVTGGTRAFINFTRRLLVEEYATALPREATVVEILETVEPESEVLRACRRLKERGYTLALDDFVYEPRFEPLVELADIVKVDFMASGPQERKEMARAFLPRGIKMLAEKVETREEFQEALDMGYGLFQGYFFSKPVIVARQDIPASKLTYLRMLAELNAPDSSFGRLSQLIEGDVGLSYRLLNYINSAAFGIRNPVNSIRQALTLLGLREIRKWSSLMLLGGMSAGQPDELMVTSAVRAKFAELLARRMGLEERADDLFLMGLFSLLDVFLGRPLAELLEGLALAEDAKQALVEEGGGGGPLGTIYRLVLAQEKGDWAELDRLCRELGVAPAAIPDLYTQAITWQQEILSVA